MRRAEWAFPLTYTRERFIRRSLSSSYAPRPDQAEYDAYVAGLNALMDEMGMGEEFVLPNLTVMFYGRPRAHLINARGIDICRQMIYTATNLAR